MDCLEIKKTGVLGICVPTLNRPKAGIIELPEIHPIVQWPHQPLFSTQTECHMAGELMETWSDID